MPADRPSESIAPSPAGPAAADAGNGHRSAEPAGDEPPTIAPAGAPEAEVAAPPEPPAEPMAPVTGQVAPASAWDDGDEPGESGDRESAVACVLPGVAVGPTLALGMTAALSSARLRRRRRRPAGPPVAGLSRRDPRDGDLTRRLERFGLARRGIAFSPNGDAPQGGGAVLVVAAESSDGEVAVDLAAGPLSFMGPGAADAGRALVTTFLAQTPPSDGRVVAVDGVLPGGPSFPGLDRAADLATALHVLETEVDRRESLGHGAPPPADLADLRSRHPDHDLPLVMLVTAAVPPGDAARLGAVLSRGRALGVTAFGVGYQLDGAAVVVLNPGATVRSVLPDGRADALRGARMFTLCSPATAELLDLLRRARTDDDPLPAGEPEAEPFPVLLPSQPPLVKVRLLGTYRLEVAGREIRSGLRAKARELLAFYLIHPEGTTLDAATEALWPEADPGRGSEWFWTALGNLRSLLRSAAGTKELMIIEREGDLYRVEPIFDVDLWRFQRALPPPGAGTGDPEWAATLEKAADLYHGELLANVDWAWAEVPRDDLRRRAVDVLVSLAATRVVAGDARAALDALSHALEVDPVAEQLYRRIMRLHAKHSGPDEVAATYRRLESRLDELGLEPTPESRRLAAELCG